MAISKTLFGTTRSVPERGEEGWGPAVTTQIDDFIDGFNSMGHMSVKQPPHLATGNGTTDDTTVIQAAIDAVNDGGGGKVLFPKGTYLITAPLRIYSNVMLVGEGVNATTISASLGNALIESATPASGINFSVVSDMTLNNGSRDTALGIGIDFTNISNGMIFNIRCTNCETGVVVNGSLNGILHSCFDQVDHGVKILGGNDNHIVNILCDQVNDTGVYINSSNGTGIHGLRVGSFGGFGIDIGESLASNATRCYGASLENTSTAGTGVRIGASSTGSVIHGTRYVNLSTNLSGDNESTRRILLGPHWSDDLGQSLSDTNIRLGGPTAALNALSTIRPGSITGMTVRVATAVTDGTLTIRSQINDDPASGNEGYTDALTTTLESGHSAQPKASFGAHPYEENNRIRVVIDTTADFLPDSNILVFIELSEEV